MSMSTVPTDPPLADSSAPVSQKKGRKKKWLAAAAFLLAGSALIASSTHGETWAMWQSDVTQQGKAVQSGTLALALSGPTGSFDTSPDKTPTSIDLSTFRIVPGDQISIDQAQAITMIGTNLKADWKVQLPTGGALTGALATPGSGVTGKVYLAQGTYDPATFDPATSLASAPLDGTGTAVVHFNQPALNGGQVNLNDGSLTDGTARLYAVEVIDYTSTATDSTLQSTQADLSAITYNLTQVR